MDIWILNHYALPPDRAGGTRHFDLARRLVVRGHTVTLIAASFDYLQRTDTRLALREWQASQMIEGVRFVWVRTRAYADNGPGRFFNMIDYARNAWSFGSRQPRPDVIVGSAVHHLAGLAAWALARHHHAPFVFETRDIWPDTLIDLGMPRWHPAVLAFGALDRFLLPRANWVISLLPLATERLVAGGAPRERISIIPNGVDWERFTNLNDLRRRAPNEPFVVMYLGAHGPANGLDTVVEAARLVQDRVGPSAIHFRLVGNGPEKANLQELSNRLQLRNLTFREPIPKKLVLTEMHQADAFIFHLRALAVLNRFGISPNKLWDYMAAARPVVFACASPNNPVAEAGAGPAVPPDNPARLAEAILNLAHSPTEALQSMGKAGREYVREHYNWDVLAQQYNEVLEAVQGKVISYT